MTRVIFILLALLAGCAAAIAAQRARIKGYKADVARLRGAMEETGRMIERRGALEAAEKKLEEDANGQRKALDETGDDDLVRRADDLFGGMPDGGE